MVMRVWGSVNGQEIVFVPRENDIWTCQVPPVEDGEYIVDLYAVDEAGNQAYTATILFTVDSKHLIFTVKVLKISGNAFFIMKDRVTWRFKEYSMVVKKCEVCGGDMYGIS